MSFENRSTTELKRAFETDECLAVRVGNALYGKGVAEVLADCNNVGMVACKAEGCASHCVLVDQVTKVEITGPNTASIIDPCKLFEAIDKFAGVRPLDA